MNRNYVLQYVINSTDPMQVVKFILYMVYMTVTYQAWKNHILLGPVFVFDMSLSTIT